MRRDTAAEGPGSRRGDRAHSAQREPPTRQGEVCGSSMSRFLNPIGAASAAMRTPARRRVVSTLPLEGANVAAQQTRRSSGLLLQTIS